MGRGGRSKEESFVLCGNSMSHLSVSPNEAVLGHGAATLPVLSLAAVPCTGCYGAMKGAPRNTELRRHALWPFFRNICQHPS